MKTMIAVVCAAAVCLPVMAQVPDAAGTWEATFYTEGGTTPATMVLKKDGEKLAGTISSHLGDAPVSGTQKGGDLLLSIVADLGNGPITITLTANLKGDVMVGVADIGGETQIDWGARRAAVDAQPAAAAADGVVDVSGAWGLDVSSDVGSGTPTITLEQTGEKLAGRYSGQLGEAPLTGTLVGNAIRFEFTVDVQGTRMTVVYAGTVDSDTMKGTIRLGDVGEGTFTGRRKK